MITGYHSRRNDPPGDLNRKIRHFTKTLYSTYNALVATKEGNKSEISAHDLELLNRLEMKTSAIIQLFNRHLRNSTIEDFEVSEKVALLYFSGILAQLDDKEMANVLDRLLLYRLG